jgi:hypothetical protein
VLAGLFFITVSSQAYEGFRCIPSLRQTRVQVLKKDKKIELMVVNPSGYDFMPQFDAAGSAFSISFNKMQAEDLKSLGDGFTYSWPEEKCKIDTDNLTVSCSGEAEGAVPAIKSYGLSTTEVTEKYEKDVYEKRRFRLSVENSNTYFVNLEFYKQNCEKFN